MERGGAYYEISFFVYFIYFFISKWITDPLVRKMAVVVLGIAVVYQLLYLLILRKKDYISFPRCLAMGCFYLSLVIFVLFVVYSMAEFFRGASIAGLFSLEGFFEFYAIPFATKTSYGGFILNLVCLIYMFVYMIVTRRKYVKSAY